MFRLLRRQLGAIFLGFLTLVGGSGAATFLAVRAQASDATVINLAGRQRMLSQRITWLALNRPDDPDLDASIQLFDQTLRALRDGGATVDPTGREVALPPAPDPDLRSQLDGAAATWAAFRVHVERGEAESLQNEATLLLAQLDSIVSAFEARAQAKLARLQVIQAVFLVAALLLLTWGYLVVRRRLVQPLASLGEAARRIGDGRLDEHVPALADDELGELGRALETMRAEVAAAHAELEARVLQRTHELTSAFEFSQEIVAQLDLEHLLCSVTDRALKLTQSQAASLCLLDADGTTLNLVASSGNGDAPRGQRQPVERDFAAQVIQAGQTMTADAACAACGFLLAHRPGQCVAAPLRAGDTTLGALCAVRDHGAPFDAHETRAFTLLANSAAIAIANARLAEAERRQAERTAALTERERLAAELHDHLAQTLSYLNLKADRIAELLAAGRAADVTGEVGRMKTAIGDAYGQVRAALTNLRETASAADDLAARLSTSLADFRETSGLPAELLIEDASALALPRATQTQVVHIVREALANIRRHAQARRATVRVSRINGAACFSVEDDGRGFDPQTIEKADHLGLAIMQARAERGGGRLTIESTPGSGTRVTASFPLAAGVAGPSYEESVR